MYIFLTIVDCGTGIYICKVMFVPVGISDFLKPYVALYEYIVQVFLTILTSLFI